MQRRMPRPFRALRGRPALLAAALAAILLASACEDPFELQASRVNVDVGLEGWALTGTAPSLPSVLIVPGYTMTRPDAAGSFDLGFDIDANGRLVVLPVGSVVAALAGTRAIDFLRPTEAYDAILEAPRSGYTSDSSLVLGVGDIFITRIASAFCQFDFRQEIYAKFRVDSIIPAERRFKVQALINPNCGFRSFQTGIPEF